MKRCQTAPAAGTDATTLCAASGSMGRSSSAGCIKGTGETGRDGAASARTSEEKLPMPQRRSKRAS
ncbi:hypothetical protein D3C81_2324340 [compost metagenome]